MPFPDIYIPGAPKAGTTTVFAYLSQFCDVFAPAIKEPHFWSRIQPDENTRRLIRTVVCEEEYLGLYSGSEGVRHRVDASTSYLYSKEAIEKICERVDSPKFIVMLRDPIERAYSHYRMDSRVGIEKHDDFLKAVETDLARGPKDYGRNGSGYVEFGQYAPHVKNLLEIAGKESVLVLFSETLNENRDLLFDTIDRFLGLDSTGVDRDLHTNQSVELRHPALHRLLYSGVGVSVRDRLPAWLKEATKKIVNRPAVEAGETELAEQVKAELAGYFADGVEELYATLSQYGMLPPENSWFDYRRSKGSDAGRADRLKEGDRA